MKDSVQNTCKIRNAEAKGAYKSRKKLIGIFIGPGWEQCI